MHQNEIDAKQEMKNNKIKGIQKLLMGIMIAVILMNQAVYANEEPSNESGDQVSVDVGSSLDNPSDWAAWNIQMANIYGIGNEALYTAYQTVISPEEFLQVLFSLEYRFQVLDKTKMSILQPMTKGVVIKELYDIAQLALGLSGDDDLESATEFMVDNGIVNGDGSKSINSSQLCTKQEAIVMAKRLFDFLAYERDEDSKGCFWKVTDDNNSVYLLGSIHVSDGSIFPMSKAIMNGFIDSDVLAVEANITQTNSEDQEAINQMVYLEEGVHLNQLISEDNYNKFAEIMESYGVTEDVYNQLKPWYAGLLVQNIQMSKQDLQSGLGVDVYFLSAATGWKPIVELEGTLPQLKMIDSFSPKLQEGFLQGILNGQESDESVDTINSMLESWKNGDAEGIEEYINAMNSSDDPLTEEYNEKLFGVRNASMSEKVVDMLENGGEKDYFVVVGAGHMVTDTGIVQRLKDLGYEVEQIK